MGLEEKIKSNPEQWAVYEAVGNYKTIVVEALAGTGKTTTLVACGEKLANQNKRVLYLAFNTEIVKETKQKALGRFDCFTAHSLALRNVQKEYAEKFRRTNERFLKPHEIIRGLNLPDVLHCADIPTPLQEKVTAFTDFLHEAKQLNQRKRLPTDSEAWRYIHVDVLLDIVEDIYTLFIKSPELALDQKFVQTNLGSVLGDPWNKCNFASSVTLQDFVLEKSLDYWQQTINPSIDDFPLGHDDYLKIWQISEPTLPYDVILFDEAQDADRVMVDVVAKQDAQVVWCGDSQQQIYGWRGAVNTLAIVPYDKKLHIRTTQRFGKPIDQIANAFLIPLTNTRIEPNPVKSGEFRFEGQSSLDPETRSFREPVELELFRTNISLMLRFIELTEHGLSVSVLADLERLGDLVSGLISMFHGRSSHLPFLARFKSLNELITYVNRLNAKDKRSSRAPRWFPDVVLLFRLQIRTSDGTFLPINDGDKDCTDWDRLLNAIKHASNSPKKAAVTLATGHKAKGLTRETVRVSQDFLSTSLYGSGNESIIEVQERLEKLKEVAGAENIAEYMRLCYVAVTRASRLLLHPFRIKDIYDISKFESTEFAKETNFKPSEIRPAEPSWVKNVHSELADLNISWSLTISKQFRFQLNGWVDQGGSLEMIKIDITVKKNDEPSSVEIRGDKWLKLKPRVERALKIGIGDESYPAVTERARIDLEKITTYLLSKNIKIEWSTTNAQYQVKIKDLQNSTEVWLFFGNRGVNKSVPSKSVGKSDECKTLLQLIQEALK